MQLKTYFFVPFLRPCMHHNYGVISGSHACRECGWHIILVAELYNNLSWRASVSSHEVQCNIPTFEALLRKYTYLFLERYRKSNNVWLRAFMHSDCLYSSLFFEHYNRILLCEWVIELCSAKINAPRRLSETQTPHTHVDERNSVTINNSAQWCSKGQCRIKVGRGL